MDAHFYFDTMCPWTWVTSRWLVDVASQRDITIVWRTFSLPMLNDRRPISPPQPARHSIGEQILRIVESLRAAGRNEDIGRFYTECGTRFHVQRLMPDRDAVEDAAQAAGVEDMVAAADEDAWDVPVRQSLHEAVARAGPDVGSPVLVLDGTYRGVFGPIVSPTPTGEDAGRLWDAMVTLLSIPSFLEIKRGRQGPPVMERP